MASSDFGHMLSVGTIRFVALEKEGGIGGGGQVSARGALAGC